MNHWTALLVCLTLPTVSRGSSGDISADNAAVLRREQDGGTVAPGRMWTCQHVQLEMASYGHTVVDCLVNNANVWFRIDNAMTWQDSWQACHAIPTGNLASIHNTGEYELTRQLYWSNSWKIAGNWIGLNKILKLAIIDDGVEEYRWSDGSRLDYQKWLAPLDTIDSDHLRKENCVCFNTRIGLVYSTAKNYSYYTWADGFDTEDCNQLKMPICKLTNPTRI